MSKQKKPTQCDRLLEYLKSHAYINPLQAWQELGIYRLSGRIYDLRHAGYDIESSDMTVLNQFGEKCTVASYRLVQEG